MHTKLEDQTRLLKRKMLAWFCMLSLFINQQKSKKNIWFFFYDYLFLHGIMFKILYLTLSSAIKIFYNHQTSPKEYMTVL